MNRLILIGNGFDLAHGMKTSYLDFIKWYITKCLVVAKEKGRYADNLFSVRVNKKFTNDFGVENIHRWVEKSCDDGFDLSTIGYDEMVSNWTPFNIGYVSPFLEELLVHCGNKRWVDIEAVFYNRLLSTFKLTGKSEDQALDKLNLSMSVLYDRLKEYLGRLKRPQPIAEYFLLMRESFRASDFESGRIYNSSDRRVLEGLRPDKTLVVSFNYTSTLGLYLSLHDSPTMDAINIHGQIDNEENPIVLGFGDELDSRYMELEQKNNNEYFKYMKSFEYLKNENYKELIRFIDGTVYQVFIMGHSCGLSDRTMLNMVFEHDNCASIKVFYHRRSFDTNFVETSYEIARHFKDKAKLRRRVVSFERSLPMPQAK